MTIERNPKGAYLITDIIGGNLVSRLFYGYTKREAIRLFKIEMKGQ